MFSDCLSSMDNNLNLQMKFAEKVLSLTLQRSRVFTGKKTIFSDKFFRLEMKTNFILRNYKVTAYSVREQWRKTFHISRVPVISLNGAYQFPHLLECMYGKILHQLSSWLCFSHTLSNALEKIKSVLQVPQCTSLIIRNMCFT